MRLNDPFRNRFLEANSCYFGGSAPKVPAAPKPVKMPEAPTIQPVQPIPAPDPIPPAPTTTKLEVQQAEDDQKQQAAKRKGVRQTIIAGETGGYGGTSNLNAGKKTVLG